jgi:hypothetical protein
LVVSALVNRRLARNAENDNPPAGQFLEVNGVRLHYVERGSGAPVVLLHGNGSMIQDFESSGLIDLASKNYRVIVFDRPGFGHSDRPRNVVWTPAAQAELINSALHRLGVPHAIVLALQLRFDWISESIADHDSEDHGWLEYRLRRRWSFGRLRYGT